MSKAIVAKACILLMGTALVIVPARGWAEYNQVAQGSGPPPIEQPLIREGTLAIKLLAALKLGTTTNEIEAETLLGQAGVSPKNGWIADYPVTPDIIGELKAALSMASDAHKIALSKDAAVGRLDSIIAQLGVEVKVANAATPPDNEDQNIVPSDEIDNYYHDEGPPIVTYYTPPEDYYYLYSWVPYPFWYNDYWFGGFFVLNDFDRSLFFHHGRHHHGGQFVSNHIRDPVNNSFVRVDPAMRSVTPTFAGIGAHARFAQGATTAINSVGRSHGSNTPEINTFSRFHGHTPGYSAPARSFTTHSNPSPSNRFGNFRSYSPNARTFTPHSGFSAPSFHGGFSAAPSFHGGFSGGRGRR